MYHVSAQGIDERMINVHYYNYQHSMCHFRERQTDRETERQTDRESQKERETGRVAPTTVYW